MSLIGKYYQSYCQRTKKTYYRTGTRVMVLLATLLILLFTSFKSHQSTDLQWGLHNNTKVILLYTDFFKNRWYLRWNHYYPCSYTCRFTYRKSEINNADAVAFHDADMPSKLPSRTNLNQIWFYFNLESPVNSKAQDYQNVFNWTMSYRTDADIFTPYGDFTPLNCQEKHVAQTIYSRRNFSQEKTKMVAWMSSNCRDSFGRLSFVNKLANYVQVDIFGKCGKFSCPIGLHTLQSHNCTHQLRQYKFYLAFENSLCVDYITEKYWQVPLENELVPIVMGGADYENLAIPGSYINVNDFDTVKELADYLMYLSNNHDAYNGYFQWKMLFKLDTPFMYGCSICTALQTRKINQTKVYPSLHRYWKEGKCLGRISVQ